MFKSKKSWEKEYKERTAVADKLNASAIGASSFVATAASDMSGISVEQGALVFHFETLEQEIDVTIPAVRKTDEGIKVVGQPSIHVTPKLPEKS